MFSIFIILSVLFTQNYTYENQNSWENCAHYFSTFPKYENYKEPLDLTQHGCNWGAWITFSNKIIAIEIKAGPWEKPEELFRSKEFLAMYKHPTYYQEAILDFLAESAPTDVQKKLLFTR